MSEQTDFNYHEHVDALSDALTAWARQQSFFAEGVPESRDANGVPYVVLAAGVEVTPEEMRSRFVHLSRHVYHRAQTVIQRLGQQGIYWVRRWPEMGWEPPRKADEWEPERPSGVLGFTMRLSRQDGEPIDDTTLGAWVKLDGAPIHRDEKLRNKYA